MYETIAMVSSDDITIHNGKDIQKTKYPSQVVIIVTSMKKRNKALVVVVVHHQGEEELYMGWYKRPILTTIHRTDMCVYPTQRHICLCEIQYYCA
jgi:hypothetical protein